MKLPKLSLISVYINVCYYVLMCVIVCFDVIIDLFWLGVNTLLIGLFKMIRICLFHEVYGTTTRLK